MGELTLTPIEDVSIRCLDLAGRLYVQASKRPLAVLVRSAEREWRLELPRVDP